MYDKRYSSEAIANRYISLVYVKRQTAMVGWQSVMTIVGFKNLMLSIFLTSINNLILIFFFSVYTIRRSIQNFHARAQTFAYTQCIACLFLKRNENSRGFNPCVKLVGRKWPKVTPMHEEKDEIYCLQGMYILFIDNIMFYSRNKNFT